jgi:hypothetical protein
MARNGIFRRRQASAEASRDPVLMIDQCVAIVTLALFLCLLGGVAFAAERGTAERRWSLRPWWTITTNCWWRARPPSPLLSAPIGEAANAGAKTEQLI